MFSIGENIIYGTNGICRVGEIRTNPFDASDSRLQYILYPLFDTSNSKIFTPVDNDNIVIRRPVSRDFAEDLFGSPFSFLECILGLFVFVSLLSALATCICRLFRIHFIPRKAEKRIAGVYLCLAAVGIYPLIAISLFSMLTFNPNESQWLITRNLLSVLGMVLSVVWMAVLSAKLLVRTRRQH